MRLAVVFALVCLALGHVAIAKPKVAVAPIDGDANGEVTDAVAELLTRKLAPVKQRDVSRAMDKLGLSGELDSKDARKLQKQLDVVAVVHGKLGKEGRKKTLQLSVSARKKKTTRFTVELTATSSKKFQSKVRAELEKRILADDDEADEPESAAEPVRRSARDDGNARAKQRVADDEVAVRKQQKKKKQHRKRNGDGDADGDGDGDDESPRAAQPTIRADLGPTFGVRRLTYAASGAMQPPPVGTRAASGRIEGEVYPLAGGSGAAAGLGLAGEYDKTFGLSIQIPGTNTKVPIDQAHYSLGARYRIAAGSASSITFGLDYAKRHYIANRAGLMNPQQLDAPDVDYTAIVPGAGLRTPAAPSIMLFADVAGMLIRSTGAIQKSDSYGAANVYGAEVDAGVDIAVAKQIALRFAAEYSQINFSFKGTGDLAKTRGVTAATDRSIGIAALLAISY